MTEGRVRDRVASVDLRVRSPGGRVSETVTAVVDTGFEGPLTLPTETIGRLRLDWIGLDPWSTADDSSHDFDLYAAEVLWEGHWTLVSVLETGRHALLGMKLLGGFRLTIDVVEGGRVMIEALPPTT